MNTIDESKFLALFNNIPQGCIIYSLVRDSTGEIVDWIVESANQVSASVMGMSPAQMKGLSAIAMFGSELFAPYLAMSKQVIATAQAQQHEIFFPISGKHYLSTIFKIDDDHIGNTNFDFTERILLEQKQKKLLADIQVKNHDLEALIRSLSHDLRAPLMNLHGFIRELKDSIMDLRKRPFPEEFSSSLEEMDQYASLVGVAAKRMDSVSSGVLNYARLGRADVQLKQLDVKRILEMLFQAEHMRLEQVHCQYQIGSLPTCFADEDLLNQIFSNLLDNSIKYRARDRKLKISVSGYIDGNFAVYEFSDNGSGIPQAFREKVFELFHRLDPRGVEPGEGMGLALVRRSVSLMNGNIYAQGGVEGHGVTFTIRIPQS